jgi:hypothetical protein
MPRFLTTGLRKRNGRRRNRRCFLSESALNSGPVLNSPVRAPFIYGFRPFTSVCDHALVCRQPFLLLCAKPSG